MADESLAGREQRELNAAIHTPASQRVVLQVDQEEHTHRTMTQPTVSCHLTGFPGLGLNCEATVAACQRTPLHNGLIRTND